MPMGGLFYVQIVVFWPLSQSAAIAKMRQEIARGVSRNRVIARARKSGATLRAIGKALGISLQWVRQIAERR
jgi:DNA-directed RNA polymerase sigma subunit (sigma70/sigma32)